LNRVPLIRTIRGPEFDDYAEPSFSFDTRRSKPEKQRGRKQEQSYNIEKDVLQHRNQTVVTPRVARIAQGLFELLKVAGPLSTDKDEEAELDHALEEARAHHQDPKSMVWLDPGPRDNHYKSAAIDGVLYSVKIVLLWVCDKF
jgi:DNA (cytosine-5)-methyltransferase 1